MKRSLLAAGALSLLLFALTACGVPAAEREYLEVFRTHVYADSDAVTTEVLSDVLEEVGEFIRVRDLGGLLTFTAEVSRETADALRDPAQFAGA